MRLGILGGGQLGMMLATAAQDLGIEPTCFDSSPDACARRVCELEVASFSETDVLEKWAGSLDALTYEFENFDVEFVSWLSELVPLKPGALALAKAQDRWAEKQMFNELDIPVAPFRLATDSEGLHNAIDEVGMPCVVKTRRGGYDGKGQVVVRSLQDIPNAAGLIEPHGVVIESFVPFEYELSIVATRDTSGAIAFYSPAVNVHTTGILHTSTPAVNLNPELERKAQANIKKVLDRLDYVGTACIEFFVHNNTLLANEMAPRVHNSGHWSIEACITSQFENHVRAVCGLPLGATTLLCPTAMVNIIGNSPSLNDLLKIEGASVHLYGKQSRPGRKLGHVTLRGATTDEVEARCEQTAELVNQYRAD